MIDYDLLLLVALLLNFLALMRVQRSIGQACERVRQHRDAVAAAEGAIDRHAQVIEKTLEPIGHTYRNED